jgi:hypothetical protein
MSLSYDDKFTYAVYLAAYDRVRDAPDRIAPARFVIAALCDEEPDTEKLISFWGVAPNELLQRGAFFIRQFASLLYEKMGYEKEASPEAVILSRDLAVIEAWLHRDDLRIVMREQLNELAAFIASDPLRLQDLFPRESNDGQWGEEPPGRGQR